MPLESRAIIEQRVRDALELLIETPAVEFKGPQPFETLKYLLAQTAIAMANRRDGGLIIIGVSDANRVLSADGVDSATSASYVPERVTDFINGFAAPPIEIWVGSVEHGGKVYVAIAIQPFDRTPIVCKKPTSSQVTGRDQMRPGLVYIRTTDTVSTRPVQTATEMSDLIEIAVTRRLSELARLLGEARLLPTLKDQLDEEVGDIDDLL